MTPHEIRHHVERNGHITRAMAETLLAALDAQAEEVGRLREVVLEHEWIGTDLNDLFCLACEQRQWQGHDRDCFVFAALNPTQRNQEE